MTDPRSVRFPPMEFEVFGTSMGVGLVAGALSVLEPFLAALAGTLAALAFAGWASMIGRRGGGWTELVRPGRLVALGLLAAGALVYGFPGPELLPFRGFLVTLAVVPLWLTERRRPAGLVRPIGGG